MAPPAARARPARARPAAPPTTERTKVLSVRLTDAEFELLVERATRIGVGPSTLARTLVRSGLRLDTAPSPSALEDELHRRLTSDAPPHDLEHLTRRVADLEARLDELGVHPNPHLGPRGR